MRRLWLLLALVAVPAGAARPKVGLALGGGGARGAAHVGILQWLEENQIPVDYVAGTSFGGLVGGLYCAGMTPADLRNLAGELDWDFLLGDEIRYEDRSFRRKEDARAFPNRLEIGLRGGVKLPLGLVDGHAIGLVLSRLAVPAGPLESFDALMIPFRCVTTDMERGRAVALDHGDLATALRATMAIPGIFAPVEIDGTVMADGGLLKNVPTDVVRAMGADVVIAVDVGAPLSGQETLDSLTGLISQSITIVVLENVRESLRQADIVLSPELSRYGVLELDKCLEIADLGHAYAASKEVLLRGLRLGDAAWAEYVAARESRRPRGTFTPSFVETEGLRRTSPEPFRQALEPFVGEPFDGDAFERELNRLYGSGLYSRLGYAPESRQGSAGLLVQALEKPHGPPFIYAGLEFAGRGFDAPWFVARARAVGIGRDASEWRADLSLGSRQELSGEYLVPLAGGWSLAPRAFATRQSQDLFALGGRAAEYRIDHLGGGLDLVGALGPHAELRLGAEWRWIEGRRRIGAALLPDVSDRAARLRARVTVDTANAVQLPTAGARLALGLDLGLRGLGGEQDLPQLRGDLDLFGRLGARGVGLVGLHGATSFDTTAPPWAQFTIGGPLRLSAYRADEFRGSSYLLGRLGYLHRVARLPSLLGGGVYLGGWYELGSAFEDIHDARWRHSAALGAVAETLLGPAFLGYSVGEGGANGISFSLGALF